MAWATIVLLAGAALAPLNSARGVAPCRSPLRTTHRAGIACCQAQPDQQELQTGQQPPDDEQITSFTDENGINRLIGRKIENPGDWLEARSVLEVALPPSLTSLPQLPHPCEPESPTREAAGGGIWPSPVLLR